MSVTDEGLYLTPGTLLTMRSIVQHALWGGSPPDALRALDRMLTSDGAPSPARDTE